MVRIERGLTGTLVIWVHLVLDLDKLAHLCVKACKQFWVGIFTQTSPFLSVIVACSDNIACFDGLSCSF